MATSAPSNQGPSTDTPKKRPWTTQRVVRAGQRRIKRSTPTILAMLFFLTLWQVLCSAPGAQLPPPLTVVEETWSLIINPFFSGGGIDKGLGIHILASLQRVMIGYILAAIAGIALGILTGTTLIMYRALDPIWQVLRTVPPLAWLPISLAVFEKSGTASIFVIFITAIWPILINTAVGVQQIPKDYINVAKVLQLSGPKYFLKILLPAIVPYMFTGLRIAIGLAWLAIVAAEMLTGGVGIGFFIWDAWNNLRLSEIILALVYIGLVGFILDRLLAFLSSLVVDSDED